MDKACIRYEGNVMQQLILTGRIFRQGDALSIAAAGICLDGHDWGHVAIPPELDLNTEFLDHRFVVAECERHAGIMVR